MASWDTNGSIIRSTDRGTTWTFTALPFKVGGNMPGRGNGERLAVDPANSNILFFGARSGNGLWKSTDAGASFTKVDSFTAVGNFAQNASDPSGYLADLQGLTFVTFDGTSGTTENGSTKRIFVGSASNGTVLPVWVSEDAGETWQALAGQPEEGFFPHKGKIQPTEKALYLTYSDGTGPFDGANGSVWRYSLTNSSWSDITPAKGASHGYGGLGLDMQKPGTLVVAALNLWWPDVQLFRSTDSGSTWSSIWEWQTSPNSTDRTLVRHHTIAAPTAPWIEKSGLMSLGWMVEALEINPFDSDHWLWGTGLTIYGGKDLTKWDATPRQNVTVESMAYGVEETAVLGLASIPGGTELLAAIGDYDGFSYRNASVLDVPAQQNWANPSITTTNDVDFAGVSVENVLRVGNGSDGTKPQVLTSTDGGFAWQFYAGVTDNTTYGGLGAYSADGDAILWSSWNKGVFLSTNGSAFAVVPELSTDKGTSGNIDTIIAADKQNGSVFYAAFARNATFMVSTDRGASFYMAGQLGNATTVEDVTAHPVVGGEVYVSTNAGVFRSTDYGNTFSILATSLTNTQQVSLGLATDGTMWNIYALGTGPAGKRLYGSHDGGATWVDIQGDKQGFGTIVSAKTRVVGSANVPGQVYIGTNGRGVIYSLGPI